MKRCKSWYHSQCFTVYFAASNISRPSWTAKRVGYNSQRLFLFNHGAKCIIHCERLPKICKKLGVAKPQTPPLIISGNRTIYILATFILGPLPKTVKDKQYVAVVTERYSKLKRAVPQSFTTTTNVLYMCVRELIISNGTPTYLLIDNGTLLVSKFLQCCARITAQINWLHSFMAHKPTDRLNSTTKQFWHAFTISSNRQSDWNKFVQLLI